MDTGQNVLMTAVFIVVVVVMLSIPMIAPGQTAGNATRKCTTQTALLSDGGQAAMDLRVTLGQSGDGVRVQVHGSGAWQGSFARNPQGAETVVFDSGGARETLTIGRDGDLLWEIDYKTAPTGGLAIGFVGACGPWSS